MLLIQFFHDFEPSTKLLLTIFSAYVFFSALTNYFYSLFRGLEHFEYEARISFVTNLLSLLLLAVFGYLHLPLYAFALIFVLTRLLAFLLAIRIASKFVRIRIARSNVESWRNAWEKVLTIGVLVFFGNLCFQLDTLLLALWKTSHEVGVYQAVVKLGALVLVVPDILATSFMPALSRLHRLDLDKWTEIGRLLSKTLTFIALTISISLFIFADQLILLIYGGQGFEEAIPLLRVFSIIILVRMAIETHGLMLTTAQRNRTRMVVIVLATLLNLTLNAFIIPRFGILGAAAVALATNLFIGVCYIVTTRRLFRGWLVEKVENHFAALIVLFIAMLLWQVRMLSVIYMVPICGIVCASVFYFVGYTREERRLVLDLRRS